MRSILLTAKGAIRYLLSLHVLYCRPWSLLSSCLVVSCLAVIWGCATLVPAPSGEPFSQNDIAGLISLLREQGEEIVSFQGLGDLSFKEGAEEIEAKLLAIGARPFKMRLELTHPWGKPLFHIVADKRHVSVLSLADKKFFRGPPEALEVKYFFMFEADIDSAWKMLSGRVPIRPHVRAVSLRPYEITLYDSQDQIVEVISFSPGSLLVRSVSFPKKNLCIMLSEFSKTDTGFYPLGITIVKGQEDQLLEIRYKTFSMNKAIPDEVFHLNPPPNFEIIDLKDRGI